MREMMAEFIRNDGRSKSSSAEGSALVGGGGHEGLNPLLHEKLLLPLLLLLLLERTARRYDSRERDDFARGCLV